MILTVSLNPSVDHALFVDQVRINDTNHVKRMERDAGGKGINVARVAAEMGADTLATGFLAGGTGAFVRHVLGAQGVKHDFLDVPGETRVDFCIEEESGLPPTMFNEPGPEISEDAFAYLRAYCKGLTANASWACFGGSLPPGVPNDALKLLIEDCRSETCSIVLDADGDPLKFGMQAGPTFVKPNTKEASRLLGREIHTDDECIQAARELEARLQTTRLGRAPIVVVSRGEAGAIMASEGQVYVGHSPQVKVNSTIGSGDSLIGAMLWALEEGKPIEDSFRYGLSAGAATATTDGSEIARRPVILDLLPRVSVAIR